MNVQELRIANIVLFKEDGIVFNVDGIQFDGLSVYNKEQSTWIELDAFQGVSLTEEWLLKFGAKVNGNSYLLCLPGMRSELRFGFHENRIAAFIESPESDVALYEIKFVHQLQNLYFALTQEELIYKN